jgi:hypothetical protein
VKNLFVRVFVVELDQSGREDRNLGVLRESCPGRCVLGGG